MAQFLNALQNFKLADTAELEDKTSNLDKQYWMEQGNLVVKGIIDYSSKDTTLKTQDQITQQFATSKLESYGYGYCFKIIYYYILFKIILLYLFI